MTVCVSMVALLWLGGDFGMDYDEVTGTAYPPPNAPSLNVLSACFLVSGTGFWMADVMGDTLVVRTLFHITVKCHWIVDC